MASLFDTHFAASGFPGLSDQFGEVIAYWPHGGSSRSITAIIEREPPAIFDAAGNAVFPKVTIRVANSSGTGIASSELDTGRDEIELLLNTGDSTSKRFSIMQILSQDSGVTHLALH